MSYPIGWPAEPPSGKNSIDPFSTGFPSMETLPLKLADGNEALSLSSPQPASSSAPKSSARSQIRLIDWRGAVEQPHKEFNPFIRFRKASGPQRTAGFPDSGVEVDEASRLIGSAEEWLDS